MVIGDAMPPGKHGIALAAIYRGQLQRCVSSNSLLLQGYAMAYLMQGRVLPAALH